jgi:hypothetical protein
VNSHLVGSFLYLDIPRNTHDISIKLSEASRTIFNRCWENIQLTVQEISQFGPPWLWYLALLGLNQSKETPRLKWISDRHGWGTIIYRRHDSLGFRFLAIGPVSNIFRPSSWWRAVSKKKSEIKYEGWRTSPTTEKQVLYWSYSPAPSVGWWFLAKTLLSLRFGSVSRPGRKGGLFFIGFGRVPDASSPSFSSRTHGHYTHKTAGNEKRGDEKEENSSQPVINPFPLPFFPSSGLEETNKIKKRKKRR